MRTFNTLSGFVRHLGTVIVAVESAGHRGVRDGAEIIREEAKHEIGTYQMSVADFEAWAPLSEATLEGFYLPGAGYIPGKVELGYAPPDNPLLRTGGLAESIECTTRGDEAAIGSDEDVAVYQELGTPNARYPIPPRSFLGGAAARKGEEVAKTIADGLVEAICGFAPRNRPRI